MPQKSHLTEEEKRERQLAVQQEDVISSVELYPVEERNIIVKYITLSGECTTRPFKLYIPKKTNNPIPLIFVAHYPMAISTAEMQSYFRHGWAVGVTDGFEDAYNRELAGNNLICNSAALWTLRHEPEIDSNRIAIVGGSAGGYMTMMLLALHANICCGSANAPIANLYFNMKKFFPEAYSLYKTAYANLSQEAIENARKLSASDVRAEKYKGMSVLPLPVLASIADSFLHVNDRFPKENSEKLYEALSPVGLGHCFTAPFLLRHFSSDGLVPMDQISKRYSYKKVGDSLPADFAPLLPRNISGKCDMSLEEALPADKTKIIFTGVPSVTEYPDYSKDNPFLLRLFDEGPMESYSGHRLIDGVGGASEEVYLTSCLSAGAAETSWLTPEKLGLLLDRWLGNSVQLPARVDAPSDFYGSLSCTRREVLEELAQYASAKGIESLKNVAKQLYCITDELEQETDYRSAMQAIVEQIPV